MDKKAQAYLDTYLQSLTPSEQKNPPLCNADYFCGDEYNANLCADLIKQGIKTATCSLAHWYTHEHEPMPQVGNLQVVTLFDGTPVCIIKTTKVQTRTFDSVDESFAYKEGEGDKTLQWWQDTHWKFFTKECEELGIAMTPNQPLVLEYFKVVYA